MQPGRKPTKKGLSLIAGGRGRPKENKLKPQPQKLLITPGVPKKLKGYARKFWQKYARELTQNGLLTKLDLPAFQLLCSVYGKYQLATDQLNDADDFNEFCKKIPETSLLQAEMQLFR